MFRVIIEDSHMKKPKAINPIPVTIPHHAYQPSKAQQTEKVHIPTTPEKLAKMVLKEYKIKSEKS